MTDGRNHADAIPRVVQRVAEHAVESRPVAAMARVTAVSDDSRRVTLELLSDDGAESNRVPVCVPFADGTSGDVVPIEPGIKGIALFLDHPVDEQLAAADGQPSSSGTGMDVEDAVFLPACITSDDEQWPTHDSGDRVWEHPSGSRIEMGDDGSVRFVHDKGGVVEVGGDVADVEETFDDPRLPEEFHDESVAAEDALDGVESQHHGGVDQFKDNVRWPIGNPGETYDRMQHPEGPHVSITRRGVSIGGTTDDDSDTVVSGQNNDPDRSELDGHHQHFHLVEHANGEKSLAGPQLTFREFLAWMTDADRQADLRNADQYAEARQYAERYLAWLEDEIGRSLDPTNPDDWPDTEPMPTPDERDSFDA